MFDALGLDGCAGFVDTGFDLLGEGGLVVGWIAEGVWVGRAIERGGRRGGTHGIVDDPFYRDQDL